MSLESKALESMSLDADQIVDRRRLRRKLEAAGLSPDAIAMVRGRGYRFSQGNSLQLVID